MAKQRPVIVIVGGGFSGSMVAVHLLQQARQPLRVVLVEREEGAGRGVAYRDQPECHLLNVRAEGMSAFPGAPDHFLDWLNGIYSPEHPVGTGEFLPRRIYGSYIESQLAQAQARAPQGVTLEIRHDEALNLQAAASGGVLRLRSGARLRADRVVLALGNPGPADPAAADPRQLARGRYLSHAWSSPGLYSIGGDEDLLLIGSGLTALDWLAALRQLGHRGRVHMLSRRGLLPNQHQPAAAHPLSFDPAALPPRVRPLLRRMRAEIAAVEKVGGDWRSAIDGLRPHTQQIWQRLPLAEKRRFLRHLRPYWEIHRHRAAPRVLAAVQELLAADRLQLLAGRLLGLEDHEEGIDAAIRTRQGRTLKLRVQRVVNCTGPESNYRRLTHPLIVGLCEQGLIQPDELGLGLHTDASGALVGGGGQPSPWLYTLGPTRKGELWETTAVPEIRIQAQALARLLLAQADLHAPSAPRRAEPRQSV
jgi:uncharacterized NAD(P)/FAD-binding protein YdhS